MPALSRLDWRLFWCLILIGLLGTWVPLFDLDEGAFLEATRELLNGGHWAVTTLDGAPRYDKPILSYWFQAITLLTLDWLVPIVPIEMIGRLPSVFAGALWAWLLGRFTAEQTGQPALGIFVSFALSTTLGPLVIMRAATADALLNLWLTLLFIDISKYIEFPSEILRLKVFTWLALGILTKGPVAVLIPCGAFFVWTMVSNRWSFFFTAISSARAWLVFAALLTPWVIGVVDAQGITFFERFILTHNFERFFGNLHGHGGHLLYYAIVMPVILLPYSALAIGIAFRIRSFWECSVARFNLVWIGFVVILISLSGTQLPHYAIYATAPIFYLCARFLPDLKSRIWAAPGLILPISILCAALLLGFVNFSDNNPKDIEQLMLLSQILGQWKWPITSIISILIFVASVILIVPNLNLTQRLLAMGGIQLALITLLVLPLLSEAKQAPLKRAALLAKEHSADVVSLGIRMPSFSFYRDKITREQSPKPGQWVLISVELLVELAQKNIPFQIKAVGPGWRLVALESQEII